MPRDRDDLPRGSYEYGGYIISRGSYVDTTDDRSDRWYVTPIDSDTWDRRGRGFRLLRIAKAAIDDPGRDCTED